MTLFMAFFSVHVLGFPSVTKTWKQRKIRKIRINFDKIVVFSEKAPEMEEKTKYITRVFLLLQTVVSLRVRYSPLSLHPT
jgi:hypothetical protein